MRMTSPYLRVALAALLFGASVSPAGASGLTVSSAWVTTGPPGVGVVAGYLTIENDSGDVRTLNGVSATLTDRIEMHESVLDGGLARMRRLKAIEIPARGSAVLAPGGTHLMLFLDGAPPAAGDTVALELHFDAGETVRIDAVVRAPAAHAGHQH